MRRKHATPTPTAAALVPAEQARVAAEAAERAEAADRHGIDMSTITGLHQAATAAAAAVPDGQAVRPSDVGTLRKVRVGRDANVYEAQPVRAQYVLGPDDATADVLIDGVLHTVGLSADDRRQFIWPDQQPSDNNKWHPFCKVVANALLWSAYERGLLDSHWQPAQDVKSRSRSQQQQQQQPPAAEQQPPAAEQHPSAAEQHPSAA